MHEHITVTYHDMIVACGVQHFFPFRTKTYLSLDKQIHELLNNDSGSDYDVTSVLCEDVQP